MPIRRLAHNVRVARFQRSGERSIRSEQRLCEEVHLNLAYRWFCRFGLDGTVPDPRRSQRTGMAAFVRAICCVICSRVFFA
jgi:hypothetical protein